MKLRSIKELMLNAYKPEYKKYKVLCQEKEELNYPDLLLSYEWREKREEIIIRDNNQCSRCETDIKESLHVHHIKYIISYLPWEYDNDDLITLCESCHSEIHKNTIIPIYIKKGGLLIKMNYTPCKRCGGLGSFQEYIHVDGGKCFRCKGMRYEELI